MITKYDRVFDPQFCEMLYKKLLNDMHNGEYVYKTNYSWQHEIVRSSGAVLIRELDNKLHTQVIKGLVDRGVLKHPHNLFLGAYIWTRNSYIPWHEDGVHKLAASVYLNPEWDLNWGGLFLYRTDDEIKAIPPVFNTAVVNEGNVFHSTSILSYDSQPRLTLQIFQG